MRLQLAWSKVFTSRVSFRKFVLNWCKDSVVSGEYCGFRMPVTSRNLIIVSIIILTVNIYLSTKLYAVRAGHTIRVKLIKYDAFIQLSPSVYYY